MASGNQTGFVGSFTPSTPGADLNAMSFVVEAILAKKAFATLVKVVAADSGTVDVQPLVNLVDGDGGTSTPHGVVNGVQFVRMGGGNGQFIADPKADDIGFLVTCDRDVSAAIGAQGQANPGSFRRFNLADSVYIGMLAALAASATQYVRLDDSGVAIQAEGDLGANASGSATISAGGSATLSAGGTASVSASLVELGSGGGSIANAPAPAKTLLSNYNASGPGAIFSNPTSAATGALASTLVPGGSIATGLAGLVSDGAITPTDQTNILNALGITGGAGLKAANTGLVAHTNFLSGLATPTTTTQPFLAGVMGIAPGLDYLAGGFFGHSSVILPTMTTGLGASSVVNAATAYANGIVALLTIDPTQVPTVISTVNGQATALAAYQPADAAAYASAHAAVLSSGTYLGFVGWAKSQLTSVQAVLAQVASPSTIATLQSVPAH